MIFRLLCIIIVLVFPCISYSEIFKHVDADGRVTYSNSKIKDPSQSEYPPADYTTEKSKTTEIKAAANSAELVYVKYRGQVDLKPFECEWVTRSSVVKRLCYDSKEQYVIVNLTGTYYHYCEVPSIIVNNWRIADSMGRFYNAQLKERFDCRINHVPAYK